MAASPGGGDDDEARRDACRLFLGNLPKAKTEADIRDEVSRVTPGLVRVITYKNPEDPRLHRGFCFLDYETAGAAAVALRRLSWGPVFGCRVVVDWADPEPEMDEQAMARVRILFVRLYGGMLDETTLAAAFGRHGVVERVKCLKHYAFVHFACRDDARTAMEALDGTTDADTGVRMEVSWAKPPLDKTVRERALRDRERRMLRSSLLAAGPRRPAAAVAPSTAAGRVYTGADYDHYVYNFGTAPVAHDGPPRQSGRRDGPADRQHRDRGDRGARADVDGPGGDMDDKIRMFFLKVIVGEMISQVTPGE